MNLSPQDIFLGLKAKNKKQALEIVANALEKDGYVQPGFYQAMEAREKSLDTYIDFGVALPHAAKEYLHLVNRGGFRIFQFPDGVNWGGGKVAFIVIAVVAATNQEHLKLVAAIATAMDNEIEATRLASATAPDAFIERFADN